MSLPISKLRASGIVETLIDRLRPLRSEIEQLAARSSQLEREAEQVNAELQRKLQRAIDIVDGELAFEDQHLLGDMHPENWA